MKPIQYADYVFYPDCRIWSNLTNTFITGNNGKDWYPCVTINGTREYVHRIVAELFILNPNNYKYVNHKDGIKTNFAVDNLEWVDGSNNAKHALKSGLRQSPLGSKNGRSKLTDDYIPIIREAIKLGFQQKDIARYFGVNNSIISRINTSKAWNHG